MHLFYLFVSSEFIRRIRLLSDNKTIFVFALRTSFACHSCNNVHLTNNLLQSKLVSDRTQKQSLATEIKQKQKTQQQQGLPSLSLLLI